MEVKITKAEAVLTKRDVLTSGMVGKTVTLAFSQDWDGLLRTAVFRAGNETRAVILNGDARTETAVIPHEVLRTPERMLRMGVYGTDAAGTEVLPTVWCELGTVQPGVDPAGDESTEATPDVWAQMWCLIETLDKSKAPAGYGYGEAAEYLGAFDTEEALAAGLDEVFAGMKDQETKLVCAKFGWYTTYYIWLIELYRDSESYGMMRAMSEVYSGSVVYATRGASGWKPLMWDNPPAYAGVEYCTTEMYNGKPVYTKLVNCGAAADAKSILYDVTGKTRLLRMDVTIGTYPARQKAPGEEATASAYYATYYVTGSSVTLYCGASMAGQQSYAQIWYIK